jgi:hypothetical protein
MQTFNVSYIAYRGDSSEVLSEGTVPVTVGSRMQAEQSVEAMFGNGNRVVIRSVFTS